MINEIALSVFVKKQEGENVMSEKKSGNLKWIAIAILAAGILGAGCGKSNADAKTSSTASDTEKNTAVAESEQPEANETDSQEETEAPQEEESQQEESDETIYEIGGSASLQDWTISVTDAKIVDSVSGDYLSYNPNEEGNKYLQVFVTVNNDGKKADSFLPSFGIGDDVSSKVLYSDGYEFTATNLLGYNNELHDSTINPLSSQTGEIFFEIPGTVAESTEELIIQFSSGNDTLKFKIR